MYVHRQLNIIIHSKSHIFKLRIILFFENHSDMNRLALAIFTRSEPLFRTCAQSYAKFAGGKLGGGVSSKLRKLHVFRYIHSSM